MTLYCAVRIRTWDLSDSTQAIFIYRVFHLKEDIFNHRLQASFFEFFVSILKKFQSFIFSFVPIFDPFFAVHEQGGYRVFHLKEDILNLSLRGLNFDIFLPQSMFEKLRQVNLINFCQILGFQLKKSNFATFILFQNQTFYEIE